MPLDAIGEGTAARERNAMSVTMTMKDAEGRALGSFETVFAMPGPAIPHAAGRADADDDGPDLGPALLETLGSVDLVDSTLAMLAEDLGRDPSADVERLVSMGLVTRWDYRSPHNGCASLNGAVLHRATRRGRERLEGAATRIAEAPDPRRRERADRESETLLALRRSEIALADGPDDGGTEAEAVAALVSGGLARIRTVSGRFDGVDRIAMRVASATPAGRAGSRPAAIEEIPFDDQVLFALERRGPLGCLALARTMGLDTWMRPQSARWRVSRHLAALHERGLVGRERVASEEGGTSRYLYSHDPAFGRSGTVPAAAGTVPDAGATSSDPDPEAQAPTQRTPLEAAGAGIGDEAPAEGGGPEIDGASQPTRAADPEPQVGSDDAGRAAATDGARRPGGTAGAPPTEPADRPPPTGGAAIPVRQRDAAGTDRRRAPVTETAAKDPPRSVPRPMWMGPPERGATDVVERLPASQLPDAERVLEAVGLATVDGTPVTQRDLAERLREGGSRIAAFNDAVGRHLEDLHRRGAIWARRMAGDGSGPGAIGYQPR